MCDTIKGLKEAVTQLDMLLFRLCHCQEKDVFRLAGWSQEGRKDTWNRVALLSSAYKRALALRSGGTQAKMELSDKVFP